MTADIIDRLLESERAADTTIKRLLERIEELTATNRELTATNAALLSECDRLRRIA